MVVLLFSFVNLLFLFLGWKIRNQANIFCAVFYIVITVLRHLVQTKLFFFFTIDSLHHRDSGYDSDTGQGIQKIMVIWHHIVNGWCTRCFWFKVVRLMYSCDSELRREISRLMFETLVGLVFFLVGFGCLVGCSRFWFITLR